MRAHGSQLLGLLFVHTLIVANPPAQAQAPAQEAEERIAVVPPGNEELLASMLGKGEPLAGCEFTGGAANGGTIRATYKCPSGEVVLQIVHPDKAPPEAVRTDRFAILRDTGSPPEDLIASLAARVRARESGFEWTWVGPRSEESSGGTSIILVVGVLAAAAFLWLLRSRSRARHTP